VKPRPPAYLALVRFVGTRVACLRPRRFVMKLGRASVSFRLFLVEPGELGIALIERAPFSLPLVLESVHLPLARTLFARSTVVRDFAVFHRRRLYCRVLVK
jgi:hypothetical protein